jgi:hypothetical protein
VIIKDCYSIGTLSYDGKAAGEDDKTGIPQLGTPVDISVRFPEPYQSISGSILMK